MLGGCYITSTGNWNSITSKLLQTSQLTQQTHPLKTDNNILD